MSRPIVGQTQSFATEVRLNGELTDSPDIKFLYKIAGGDPACEATREITPTHIGLGTYAVTVVNYQAGTFYPRWDTDGTLDIAQERPFRVYRSAHSNGNNNDYI